MKYMEYNENKKHGTDEFPLEYYYVDKNYYQYVMPLHRHNEFEIIRVISGSFMLYVDNIAYELKSGDYAFVGCGELHRGTPQSCVYQCLVFDLNMLRSSKCTAADKYIVPLINKTASVNCIFDGSHDLETREAVTSLFMSVYPENKCNELEIIGRVYSLFSSLYRNKQIIPHTDIYGGLHQTRIMTELLDYMDCHFSEPVTLCDLSRVSGYSEKYLCKIFKKYTSKTPIEYINMLRINNACRDMISNDSTVTEAALNSGYSNNSYFCRMFKQLIGCTPKEYKQKNIRHRI